MEGSMKWVIFLLLTLEVTWASTNSCQKLGQAFAYYDNQELNIPISITSELTTVLTLPFVQNHILRNQALQLESKPLNFAEIQTLYVLFQNYQNSASPKNNLDIESILADLKNTIQTVTGKGNSPPDPRYRQYQMAKYEILRLLQQEKSCVIRPKDLNKLVKLPENDGPCYLKTSGLLDQQQSFISDNLDIIMQMDTSLYEEYYKKGHQKRLNAVNDIVCHNQNLPPKSSEDENAKGAIYFCSQVKKKRSQRKQYRTRFIAEEKYTFKNWIKGNHRYHRGPPGLASGILGAAHTALNYWRQRTVINYAQEIDSYHTNMAIFAHKFRATNCIAQQSVFDFNWQFLNQEGTPLSTNGLPVRSDLSNWDLQKAGNFTNCNPKTFVSPFYQGSVQAFITP